LKYIRILCSRSVEHSILFRVQGNFELEKGK